MPGFVQGTQVGDSFCFMEGNKTLGNTRVVVSNLFYVHLYLGKCSNLTNIFSDGLKPPTSFALPWKEIKPCKYDAEKNYLLHLLLILHKLVPEF